MYIHKDSITVADASGPGEVELLGKIGTTQADIDHLCRRLQAKARYICVVYEAGPCGFGLYRQFVQNRFGCMRAGDLSAVYVPSEDDEAFRDPARTWVAPKTT
ncbi:hypothetical protein OKW46_002028 [Paraburkholderia sp. WSM4179]|nr:hypothetical protein [Paraburkholderia sp. WSM4179]